MPSFLPAVIRKRPLLDWYDCTCSFFFISIHSMIKLKLLNSTFEMKVMTKTYSESFATATLQIVLIWKEEVESDCFSQRSVF